MRSLYAFLASFGGGGLLLLLAAAAAKAELVSVPDAQVQRPHTRLCKVNDRICSHLVVTRGGTSVNYHFDQADEKTGISFQVVRPADGSWHRPGAILYGTRLILRRAGEQPLDVETPVSCYRATADSKDGVICTANLDTDEGGYEVKGIALLGAN